MVAKRRASAPGLSGGFTLIEALVIVAILALISGIAFPRIEQMMTALDLKAARTMIISAAQDARAQAVRTDMETPLTVSSDGARLLVAGKVAGRLPPGFIVDASTRPFVYFADGSANGGTLVLTKDARNSVLELVPENGGLRWVR